MNKNTLPSPDRVAGKSTLLALIPLCVILTSLAWPVMKLPASTLYDENVAGAATLKTVAVNEPNSLRQQLLQRLSRSELRQKLSAMMERKGNFAGHRFAGQVLELLEIEQGVETPAIPERLERPVSFAFDWNAVQNQVPADGFIASAANPDHLPSWHMEGIGFPSIEQGGRHSRHHYQQYSKVVDWHHDEDGNPYPIADVRCMGLNPSQIARRAKRYEGLIVKYAEQYKVSVSLVKAVITKESCFNPNARSYVGATGLMQLMPETAKWLHVANPKNPEQNLRGGIRYLASLRKRFGTDELALAAYNAGPGNVRRFGGIPPFAETQQYVVSVIRFYRQYEATAHYAMQLAMN